MLLQLTSKTNNVENFISISQKNVSFIKKIYEGFVKKYIIWY